MVRRMHLWLSCYWLMISQFKMTQLKINKMKNKPQVSNAFVRKTIKTHSYLLYFHASKHFTSAFVPFNSAACKSKQTQCFFDKQTPAAATLCLQFPFT